MKRYMSSIRSIPVGALALTLLSSTGAFADMPAERSVDEFTCKQVMAEPAGVREATIAFMQGYLLGKSNTAKFNIEALLKRTDGFIDSCLDNPAEKAIGIMEKAGG